MFEDALADDLIESNPCAIKRGELPAKIDKDPTWRSGAVFTREEVEQLLSDDRIPEERRTLYALLFLGGMRIGEAEASTSTSPNAGEVEEDERLDDFAEIRRADESRDGAARMSARSMCDCASSVLNRLGHHDRTSGGCWAEGHLSAEASESRSEAQRTRINAPPLSRAPVTPTLPIPR